MLKKISKILLLAVAGLSLTFGFVACSNDDDDDDENQNNNSSGTDSSSSTSGSSSVAYLGSLDSSDGKLTISSDGFVFQQKEDDGSYSNSLKGSVAKATDEYVYLKAEYDWVTDWAKRGDEASGGSGIDVAYFYAVLTAPASGATEGSFKSYSSDEEGYTAKKAYIVYTTSTAMAFDTIFVAADNTFKGSLAGTEIASGECKLDGSSLYLKYTSAGTTTYLKVTLDTSAKIYTFDAITGSIDEAAYTGAKSETIDTGSSSSSSGNGDSENSGNTGKTDDKTGDNTGKTDDDNTGKTETGDATYTWVSEEGNLTIATKADATFTATESSMNIIVFSGTYTKTGNSLVVTIKKELNDDDSALVDVKEEETLNFTIGANNVLTLASGGDTEHELVNYTVYHSFETLEGEYVVDETLTETLEGILGDKTAAVAKTVTGFTTDAITQETIGKDTKVTIKYKRITVTISFDCGEYATVESINGKYGATVTAPENPTREGYTFKAWEPALPETFTEDMTVNATWERETGDVSGIIY